MIPTKPTTKTPMAMNESENFSGRDHMKKIITKIIAAVMLITLVMSIAACGSKNIYDTYAKEGYTIRVRYDVGGGAARIKETQNVTIVEVYNEKDVVTKNGKTGIALLAPDDPLRGDGILKIDNVDPETQSNFYPIGWYTKRTPRVDSEGAPLDIYGEKTSVSNREQAYIYEDKWDFDNDVVDPAELENGELTLYAAWAPYFTYEFYSEDESGAFVKIGEARRLELRLPKWNERKERYDMRDFPKVEGMTFVDAYLDEGLTQQLTDNLDGRTKYTDYEKGILTQTVIKIYVRYEKTISE